MITVETGDNPVNVVVPKFRLSDDSGLEVKPSNGARTVVKIESEFNIDAAAVLDFRNSDGVEITEVEGGQKLSTLSLGKVIYKGNLKLDVDDMFLLNNITNPSNEKG